MMSYSVPIISLLCTFILAFASFGSIVRTANVSERSLRGTASDAVGNDIVTCHVSLQRVALETDVQKELLRCTPLSEDRTKVSTYKMRMSDDMAQALKADIRNGHVFVNIRGGRITDNVLTVPENAQIEVPSRNDEQQQKGNSKSYKEIDRTVLVLRVSTEDSTPDLFTTEVYQRIFNDKEGLVVKNPKGAVRYSPTEYGVLDVKVPEEAAVTTNLDLVDAANKAAIDQIGASQLTDVADHVMFCLPPGTGSHWVANIHETNRQFSVYNNRWCGHQLGISFVLKKALK